MTSLLTALSVWLHALATIVFIGHYLLLHFIYLPVLAKGDRAHLSAISKRSRPWLYAAMLALAVTGVYLTLVDSEYLGLGNFGNLWAMLMLVKHVLILAMLAMAGWHNAILRLGPLMSANTGADLAVTRFTAHVKWMAICGVLVILLTALAVVE